MKDIPLITSAALIWWGYLTGNIVTASIFSILIELHRFSKFKLDFKYKDFNYISMITTLSLAGFIIYYINSPRHFGLFSSVFQFMPIALFPLTFFFLYSTSDSINARRLFLLFEINRRSSVNYYTRIFRPDYLYFAFLLIAIGTAGGGYSHHFIFLLVSVIILKSAHENRILFRSFLFLTAAFILSVTLQTIIFFTFSLARSYLTELYLERFLKDRERSVRIGNIAGLKQSFRIDLRAEVYGRRPFALYLRDRIYNSYHNGIWLEKGTENISLPQELIPYGEVPMDSVRVFFFSQGRSDLLKMPFGTFDFSGVEPGRVKINSLGNATQSYTQYLNDYKAYIRTDTLINLFSDPFEDDLVFFGRDTLHTDNLIEKLDLQELGTGDVFLELRDYFTKNFSYSLEYEDWPLNETMDLFMERKEGHCELFATLSALTYRRLGHPARYVTGYYLSEYSSFENKFIGRRKDRHAWIMVWNDESGKWAEYDTTPPDITNFRTEAPFFEKIYSILSYAFHRVFMFRKENEDLFEKILLFSLIPLGLFLLYRILKDVKTSKKSDRTDTGNSYSKLTELEMIDNKMRSEGFKVENEPVSEWFERIRTLFENGSEPDKITRMYYSRRYGKTDLNDEDRKSFEKAVENLKRKNPGKLGT